MDGGSASPQNPPAKKKKDKKGKRNTARKRQPVQLNAHFGLHFVIKPLSNFDLIDWLKNLESNIFEEYSVAMDCRTKFKKNVE